MKFDEHNDYTNSKDNYRPHAELILACNTIDHKMIGERETDRSKMYPFTEMRDPRSKDESQAAAIAVKTCIPSLVCHILCCFSSLQKLNWVGLLLHWLQWPIHQLGFFLIYF